MSADLLADDYPPAPVHCGARMWREHCCSCHLPPRHEGDHHDDCGSWPR